MLGVFMRMTRPLSPQSRSSHKLFEELVALVHTSNGMPKELTQMMGQVPAQDLDEVGPPIAILLAGCFCMFAEPVQMPGPTDEVAIFTPPQTTEVVRAKLREAWHEFRMAPRDLCPAVEEIEFDFVLHHGPLFAFFQRRVADVPFLPSLVAQLTNQRFPALPPVEGERAESALQLAMLLVELEPLLELRQHLANMEEESAWAHPDMHESNADGSLSNLRIASLSSASKSLSLAEPVISSSGGHVLSVASQAGPADFGAMTLAAAGLAAAGLRLWPTA